MQFSDVIGQQSLKEELIREIKSGRVSHAQLFSGKHGHGTLSLALAFTRYILCENKQETDSCGECHSCKQMNDFVHPDVHFVFPIMGVYLNGEGNLAKAAILICLIGQI